MSGPFLFFAAAVCLTTVPLLASNDQTQYVIEGNVVSSLTGEPLRHAAVTLQGVQSQVNNAGLSADAAGHFLIPNLPPGDYTLSASKQGYAPTPPVHVALGTVGAPSANDVVIKLLPFGRISGKVVDDSGDPILNANLQIFRSTIQNGRRVIQPVAHALTNDLGEYHVANLTPGRYYVSAVAPPEADGTAYARTFYGGGSDIASAAQIDLPPGGTQAADLRMQPVHSYAVRGKIDNLPENMHPYLNIARRGSVMAANESHATRVDAATGTFELSGVTPGDWMVTAACFDQGTPLSGSAEVVVSDGDVESLTVALSPVNELTGSIRTEGDIAPGTPAPSPYIALRPARDGSQPAMGASAKPDGTFSISGVQPGEYTLVVRAREPWYVKSIKMGGHEIANESFTINPSGTNGFIEVILARGGGKIFGTVVEGSSSVTSGGWVLVLGPGAEHIVSVNPAGQFQVGALAPGEYTAYAFQDLTDLEYTNPDVMQRFSSARISVTEGASQQIELKLNRTVY